MNRHALTGASYPMKLGAVEFAVYSLNDKDYIELDSYIQSKVIEVARNQLDGLSSSDRAELLQAAIKAAASTGWGTPEGVKVINTTEGVIRLGWQMAKRDKPRLSFEEFSQIVHGKSKEEFTKNLIEIDTCYIILHGDSDEEPKEASPEPKSS